MIGIVLAAGNATRLPNKLLLPMHNCRPLILSSVEYLRANNVEEIRVVVSQDSAVEPFLRRYYGDKHRIRCITQTMPKGVVNGILTGILEDDHWKKKLVVVCGDNVYPAHEKTPRLRPPFVVGRRVPRVRARHLVQWDHRVCRWVRSEFPTRDPICLTTPWVFTVEQMRSVELDKIEPDRMEDMLNLCSVTLAELPINGWWDIGTHDMFMAYWRS